MPVRAGATTLNGTTASAPAATSAASAVRGPSHETRFPAASYTWYERFTGAAPSATQVASLRLWTVTSTVVVRPGAIGPALAAVYATSRCAGWSWSAGAAMFAKAPRATGATRAEVASASVSSARTWALV